MILEKLEARIAEDVFANGWDHYDQLAEQVALALNDGDLAEYIADRGHRREPWDPSKEQAWLEERAHKWDKERGLKGSS
jgi:hypothetical protein